MTPVGPVRGHTRFCVKVPSQAISLRRASQPLMAPLNWSSRRQMTTWVPLTARRGRLTFTLLKAFFIQGDFVIVSVAAGCQFSEASPGGAGSLSSPAISSGEGFFRVFLMPGFRFTAP